MTRDELTQRLAQITVAIEEHGAAVWRLEDERLQLRQQLRGLEVRPSDASTAQVSA